VDDKRVDRPALAGSGHPVTLKAPLYCRPAL